MARQVLDNGVILPSEYSDDWYDDMTSNLTKLDEVIGSDAEKLSASDVGAAAISNDYDDLDDKPAYNILRRASVTLTAGGTGNYTDLDSDSKIKSGDYVLDAANKLYSITAIDTANSTYTVSSAAIINITDKSELGAAALSNSYDDLNNLPSYGITRYVNTAITDNSNVAFASISSVSKIAAGDFLLDTAGKMYVIASVDTANETAAVTTPVTQLAIDSGVVHKSGNETVSGDKTFTGKIYSNDYYYGSIAWGLDKANTWANTNTFQQNIFYERTNLYHQVANPCYILKDTGLEKGNLVSVAHTAYPGLWQDKNMAVLGYMRFVEYVTGRQTAELRVSNLINNGALDPTGAEVNCGVQLELQPAGEKSLIPETNNDINLGTSTNKWKSFNSLTPSSLSLPADSYIDISGYVTDLTGGNNQYTAPANGWIYVDSNTSISSVIINNTRGYSTGFIFTGQLGRQRNTLPVCKDDQILINVNCTGLNAVRFIPCQGNV